MVSLCKAVPIVLASKAALGCAGAWGSPLELPEGLREDSTVYAVVVDHKNFDIEEPKQRVTFEVEQGRGSECATTYRIWGETPRAEVSVDEVSEAKRVVARRRRELWVKGKQSDALVLRANFTGLSIESDEGQTDYEEGKGAFFVGEERVGTFESDGGVLNASLAGPSGVTTDYVVIAQPYRRQYSIQAASRDLLYAAVDWSYWGFGSRGFEVAIANDLSCEQFDEVVALFLIAKVLSGA